MKAKVWHFRLIITLLLVAAAGIIRSRDKERKPMSYKGRAVYF